MQDCLPLIRVGVVEDDPRILLALCASVQDDAAMHLCLQAASVAAALAGIHQSTEPCDVLVLDMGLPDGTGLQVLRRVREAWPDCAVLVYTSFSDEAHVLDAIEAGAVGYVLKDAASAELTAQIRCAFDGGSPISPLIARQILQRMRVGAQPPARATRDAPAPDPNVVALSPREQEVLQLLTKGYTAQEIAGLLTKPAALGSGDGGAPLSRHTVLHFVRRIYVKLQVSSKAKAIFEARLRGLI